MRACPALAVFAVVFAAHCVGCVVVAVVVSVDEVVTQVEDTLPVAAASLDLYKDYPGPDQQAGTGGGYPAGYDAGYPGSGAGGYPGGGYGAGAYEVEPSRQIMVRNVSRPVLASR